MAVYFNPDNPRHVEIVESCRKDGIVSPCPRCNSISGDDFSHCPGGFCPVPYSGHPLPQQHLEDVIPDDQMEPEKTAVTGEIPGKYRVYLNGFLYTRVYTERQAWDVIGHFPWGSLHEVHDDNGICREFIP